MNIHKYQLQVQWTGNTGPGTTSYKSYNRSYTVATENKSEIHGSSDPAFRGDPTKYNPEELLLASLSSCHMLWYLHLCAEAGIVVVDYVDHAKGIMFEAEDGGGQFSEVLLQPIVTVTDSDMVERANELHKAANKLCFIARSVNFEVKHRPVCNVDSGI